MQSAAGRQTFIKYHKSNALDHALAMINAASNARPGTKGSGPWRNEKLNDIREFPCACSYFFFPFQCRWKMDRWDGWDRWARYCKINRQCGFQRSQRPTSTREEALIGLLQISPQYKFWLPKLKFGVQVEMT